ncbi:hypothetical protein LLEC1_07844 [Akanthomyces lecanii]|uniref:Uncharacterized protein n=1 Tax=Cordyceps confragosa TaxID=2714763 RepID=A0A179IIB0_CORDF|nr:hypothetical protein LLEC1_07844 [Akanthomyces lecanii]
MSNVYTIEVQNERGANTNYAMFMDTPQFSDGQQPWMNVWYTSFVPSGGTLEVRTGADFYAWTGTVPTSPAPGVVVVSGMSLLSRLGTPSVPGSAFDLKVIESFPTLQELEPTAPAESFQFNTGSDFNMPNNNYLVGLAKVNHRGQVAPVASIAPRPNSKVQITPKMKFFVTESHQVPGEIADHDSVTRDGATIDFTAGPGKAKFFARVVQGPDGRFTVTYSDSDE